MKKILIIFILIGFSFGLFSSYFLPDSAATLTYGEVKTIPGYGFVIDSGTTEAGAKETLTFYCMSGSTMKQGKLWFTIPDKYYGSWISPNPINCGTVILGSDMGEWKRFSIDIPSSTKPGHYEIPFVPKCRYIETPELECSFKVGTTVFYSFTVTSPKVITLSAPSFIKADKSFYTIDDKFTITGNVGKIIPGETFKIGFHKPDGKKIFSSTVITPRSDGSFTYGSTVTSFFFSPVGTWKISMEYGSIYAEDIFQVSAPTSIQEDKPEFTEERKEKYESNTLTGFAFIAIIAIIIIAVIVIKRRR